MNQQDKHLASALESLACSVNKLADQLGSQNGQAVVLQRLEQLERNLMSAISDFGDKVNASFDKLGTTVDGVAADVDFLKAEIKKLQENPGPITPADQAILDGIEARTNALSAKVEALDAQTEQPPVP